MNSVEIVEISARRFGRRRRTWMRSAIRSRTELFTPRVKKFELLGELESPFRQMSTSRHMFWVTIRRSQAIPPGLSESLRLWKFPDIDPFWHMRC